MQRVSQVPASAPSMSGVRRRTLQRTINPTAWLFILPAGILYVTFVLSPFLRTVWWSLYQWDGLSPAWTWVGLGNYTQAFTDPIFWRALGHNVVFLVMNLTLPVTLGLLLATLIASVTRGRTVYRVGLFLPYVLSLAVVGIIFGRIYDPNIGIVNQVLRAVGAASLARPWLGDANTVLVAINLAGVWHAVPFAMMIYLAGLQAIDPSLYDAAKMDGANAYHTFRNVTLPSLSNVTTLLISGAFIGSLTAYTLVWTTTKGGPFYASEVISTYIFKRAFEDIYVGYGAALSTILAALALSVTGVFVWLRERGD
ncbi:MAG: sugar ABC transporter permease [Chloroflexi bacterium]|nr:sugar ABC transporter permease [Chloroflexota bacterium]